MKTVILNRDYAFRVSSQAFIQYLGGVEYKRVPEAQAEAIVAAGAGKVIEKAAKE